MFWTKFHKIQKQYVKIQAILRNLHRDIQYIAYCHHTPFLEDHLNFLLFLRAIRNISMEYIGSMEVNSYSGKIHFKLWTDNACTKYQTCVRLSRSYFNRKSYKVYFQLYEKPEINLGFFLDRTYPFNDSLFILNHQIREMKFLLSSEDIKKRTYDYYKVFYNEDPFSWKSAMSMCRTKNMTIPAFSSKSHIIGVFNYIHDHYDIQPHQIFTLLNIGVSNVISFSLLMALS